MNALIVVSRANDGSYFAEIFDADDDSGTEAVDFTTMHATPADSRADAERLCVKHGWAVNEVDSRC